MAKPHKYADVVKAWADGIGVQYRIDGGEWTETIIPTFFENVEWRIKPEPKPDVVAFMGIEHPISIDEIIKDRLQAGEWHLDADHYIVSDCPHQLKLTFDGETGKLKSAEVIS